MAADPNNAGADSAADAPPVRDAVPDEPGSRRHPDTDKEPPADREMNNSNSADRPHTMTKSQSYNDAMTAAIFKLSASHRTTSL